MPLRSSRLDPRLVLVAAIALAVAGCAKKEAPTETAAAPAAAPSDALEGQVDIVAWPGYIERGETDKNYDWVTPFEKDTGCKVNVKTAGTSDEMVSLMTQGGYDLVTASGDASLRLIRGGTVQPIDISRVPSYANIDERLKEAPWHFVDGKHYGTPYQWGPNVLMYNTKVFKTAPTSWSVVFEEQKLPGRQVEQGSRPGLRRPDLHRRCGAVPDGEEAGPRHQEPVRAQRGAVHGRARPAAQAASAACSATGTTPTCRCRTSPTKASSPRARGRSRSTRWSPTSSRSRARCPRKARPAGPTRRCSRPNAKHPNCAYKWMEWSLNAKVQGDVAAWFGSVPAVPAACKGNALLERRGLQDQRLRQLRQDLVLAHAGSRRAPRAPACPYSRWATDYVAVMGGR